jgi:hypothetical protein
MSLASQTAKTASNMNLALTLNWFIGEMEGSQRSGRAGMSLDTALSMINEHLTDLEAKRVALVNEPRVKREIETNPQLEEVVK